MSTRPLEKLPTIRGKLGSTIVVAVAITIAISYGLIGFALRNSPKDSEAIDALSLARKVQLRRDHGAPVNTMVARRDGAGIVTHRGHRPRRHRRRGSTTTCRTGGWWARNVYAFLPLGHRGAAITVMRASPSRGSLGRISATLGFLQSVWWQFLLAGAIAAVIALVLARWLARGMTQPLRDMAAAAKRMETGDYTTRVHHHQPGRGRPARRRVQPHERRNSSTWRPRAATWWPTSRTSSRRRSRRSARTSRTCSTASSSPTRRPCR